MLHRLTQICNLRMIKIFLNRVMEDIVVLKSRNLVMFLIFIGIKCPTRDCFLIRDCYQKLHRIPLYPFTATAMFYILISSNLQNPAQQLLLCGSQFQFICFGHPKCLCWESFDRELSFNSSTLFLRS